MSVGAYTGVPNSPWRLVDVGTGFQDGINFDGEFDALIVNESLAAVSRMVGSKDTSYCLRLEVDSDGQGYFHRFGDVLPAESPLALLSTTTRFPLQSLVPDCWTWPCLAIREGVPPLDGLDSADIRQLLRRVSWEAVMRIQCGASFVGYFKIVGLDQAPLPDTHTLLDVAYRTKFEVANLIAYRHVSPPQLSDEFKWHLRSTGAAIELLPDRFRDIALRHVANMLTSHLGAGWNRAACYCPVSENKLRCLWAQGGDGSQSWIDTVQLGVGERIRQVSELVNLARYQPYPAEDRYFRAAAGDFPVEINDIEDPRNSNILAQLWRARGDIRKLPSESQEWEICRNPIVHMSTVDRQKLADGGPLAASFRQTDSWVQQTVRERPHDPIFVSRSGKYFALPWRSGEELIGIWVVDMAYWRSFDMHGVVPSLVLSAEILSALSSAVSRHRMHYWGSVP